MQNTTMSCEPKPIEKRKFRFDKTTPGSTGPWVESRSLLGMFRLWDDHPTADRRRTPRHQVVESQVWLGWWRGESGFLATSALIINLSRGGAMIFLDEEPPKDEPVWICLGMPDPVSFVEARVVAIQLSKQGQCAVRLEFREPCPYGFFEAAISGLPTTDPKNRRRTTTTEASAEGESAPQPG